MTNLEEMSSFMAGFVQYLSYFYNQWCSWVHSGVYIVFWHRLVIYFEVCCNPDIQNLHFFEIRWKSF